MKTKQFLSLMLLVPALTFLPACDWFKSSAPGTASQQKTGGIVAGSEEVVVTINGQPSITVSDFNKNLEALQQAQPMLQQMLPMMPADQQRLLYTQIAENLAAQELVEALGKREGWTETAEYKKNSAQMHEDLDRELASRELQQQLLKTISVADREVKKFYEDNKKTGPYFQRPPFMTKAAAEGQEAQYAPFDAVKDYVKEMVMGERFQQAYLAKINDLKSKESVVVNNEFIEGLIVAPAAPEKAQAQAPAAPAGDK